jgi:hypothetical protein
MSILEEILGFGGFTPEERATLAAIARGNEWLRAVLCTLARRGLGYRQAQPDRAREIIRLLSPYPFYKAGQFLFDLMEWEDFMLDGPAPPILPAVFDGRALSHLSHLLHAVRRGLDGSILEEMESVLSPPAGGFPDENLPPIEPSLYLYQDVILGSIFSIAAAQAEEKWAPSLSLVLDPPVAEVDPGEAAAIRVQFTNDSLSSGPFQLSVDGLPEEWVTFVANDLTVQPGGQAAVLLTLHPPRRSQAAARQYDFEVRAAAQDDPGIAASAAATLIVQPYTALYVDMRPAE